jgi:hypothetical protein
LLALMIAVIAFIILVEGASAAFRCNTPSVLSVAGSGRTVFIPSAAG